MNGFNKNKILTDKEVVADDLIRKREELGISIDEVSQELKIKPDYIKAIEEANYSKMPPGVYRRNFLKKYCAYLGIEYKKINMETGKNSENIKFSKQVIKGSKFLVFPKIIKAILVATVVLACFIYLGYSVNKVFSPPEMNLMQPTEDIIITDNHIDIVGMVEDGTMVTVNGEEVPVEVGGTFNKRVELSVGVNTIIINAKQKYGREKTIVRQVLLEEVETDPNK